MIATRAKSVGVTHPDHRYLRATPRGQAALAQAALESQSPYLHDVLGMCHGGICVRELRQFMPPQSLQASVNALLALGLIEPLEQGDEQPA